MENSSDKKLLAHFLDNKNFPSIRKRARRRKIITEEATGDTLTIVNGEVVMNNRKEREAIEEDRITSFSYGKAYSVRSKWTREDTLIFYKALSLCGTDFTMLEKIFTDKDRKQIKNKFSKEEKEYPEKINHALSSSIPFSKKELLSLCKEYTDLKS